MTPWPVLLINDYIEHGASNMNVLEPILRALGYPVSGLLTAVMSHSFEYGDYDYFPLTEHLRRTLPLWEKQGFTFAAVATGFIDSLGSLEQFALLRGALPKWRAQGSFILVDPVMGDNGALYPTLPRELVTEMRTLLPVADIITPNWTEAALLLGEDPACEQDVAPQWLERLCALGTRACVITGAGNPDANVGTIYYRSADGHAGAVDFARLAPNFSGSGDYFNAVLLAALLRGESLAQAVKTAARFIEFALRETQAQKSNAGNGLVLRGALQATVKKWTADE